MVFEERKKRSSLATSRGVDIERNEKKRRYRKMSLMLNEEGVKHILLACVENKIRKMTCLMKEENVCVCIKKASYRKIFRFINKGLERNLGSF